MEYEEIIHGLNYWRIQTSERIEEIISNKMEIFNSYFNSKIKEIKKTINSNQNTIVYGK